MLGSSSEEAALAVSATAAASSSSRPRLFRGAADEEVLSAAGAGAGSGAETGAGTGAAAAAGCTAAGSAAAGTGVATGFFVVSSTSPDFSFTTTCRLAAGTKSAAYAEEADTADDAPMSLLALAAGFSCAAGTNTPLRIVPSGACPVPCPTAAGGGVIGIAVPLAPWIYCNGLPIMLG